MGDGTISQEEIDALINSGGAPPSDDAGGASDSSADAGDSGGDAGIKDVLTDMEKDALGEIGNISMGSAATTLSVLLGRKVSITTPTTSVATMDIIKEHYPMPYLVVEVGYTIGIDGNNVLAIQAQDAAIIADLMMGGDGTSPETELTEIHMSAVGEAMNQMMGTVATSLSTMFNKKIDISPPVVNLIDFGSEEKITDIVSSNDPVARISFRMEVEGLIDSEIMQLLPINVAKEMVEFLLGGGADAAAEEEDDEPTHATSTANPAPPPPPQAAAPPPQQSYGAPPPQQSYGAPPPQQPAGYPPQQYPPQQQYAAPPPGYGAPNNMQPHVATGMPISPVQFAPLATEPVQVNDANIGLILDVPLQVTVELGRTRKSIKEILELSNGSIVELDKLAGEPVEIQVNGRYLAKGEVVVIDENFGVRITEIASPAERAARLQ
ncbi:MAG: flagellar motor switch phosphatase FliY [Selenomonadaceae bacterium]|nr:flagellar motor switch phosphatase FliY [Selenomonadaceae bacterium]